jgi:hypothetical protein
LLLQEIERSMHGDIPEVVERLKYVGPEFGWRCGVDHADKAMCSSVAERERPEIEEPDVVGAP